MSVLLETRVQRVSLALRLLDDLTDRPASGAVSVSLPGRPYQPVRNQTGYFVFADLPAEAVQILVRSGVYLPEDLSVTLPLPDPRSPTRDVTLRPSRAYPFPPGSTLVRGVVEDAAGVPVSGASIQGVGRSTRTGPDGRFVAYFKGLTEDDITVDGRKRLVKAPDGTTDLKLTVALSGFPPRQVTVSSLEEGTTRVLGGPVVLVAL